MTLYFSDISAQTTILVRTSYYGGRYTKKLRLKLGMIICILCTLISSLTEFITKYILLDIDYFDKSVKSMLSMSTFAFDVNIGSGLLIIYMGRLLLTIVTVVAFSVAADVRTRLNN